MNAAVQQVVRAAPVGTALPFQPFDGQLAHLPPDWIAVQPGFNPRTFFEDAEFAALVASVGRQGVLQAVWVRPQEGFDPAAPRFWLIAGERRWRAARAAGLASVPATIRLADERQALILADLENNPALRVNLSAAEEARFARRFLAECAGDRAEAARLLGWTRAKLDARLLLLHASANVLDALAQRRIHLGHAELLAGLPASTQDGTLVRILSDRIAVADLKARIQGFALDLSAAIFDKTACAACPHNSALQSVLFAETVAGGRCQNRACFHEKTQAALAARKAELAGEYPTVFLDTERPADTYTVLSKTGPQGVGAVQFAACQGCQHFAGLLSTQPGREGTVQAPLCANLTCHRAKVAAAQPVLSAAPAATTPEGTSLPARPVAPASEARAEASPKRVEAWVDGWLRRQAATAAAHDPDLLRAWLLVALYRDAGQPHAVLAQVGVKCGPAATRAVLIPLLYALDAQRKQTLLLALTRHLIQNESQGLDAAPGQGEWVDAARASLTAARVDLAAAFAPDADFWRAHTKAGIAGLLAEAKSPEGVSFADWYLRQYRPSASDTQAFERLLNGTRADLIAALGKTAFDFSAWLPEIIARRFTVPPR